MHTHTQIHQSKSCSNLFLFQKDSSAMLLSTCSAQLQQSVYSLSFSSNRSHAAFAVLAIASSKHLRDQPTNLPTERTIPTSRRLPFQFSVSFLRPSIQIIYSSIYIIQQKQSHQSVLKVRFMLGAGIKSQSWVLKFMEDFYNLPVFLYSYCLSSKNTHLLLEGDWIQIKELPAQDLPLNLVPYRRCLFTVNTNKPCMLNVSYQIPQQ